MAELGGHEELRWDGQSVHDFLQSVLVVFVYDFLALHAEKRAEMALSDVVKFTVFLLESLVEDLRSEIERVFEKFVMNELVGVYQFYDFFLSLLQLSSQDTDKL